MKERRLYDKEITIKFLSAIQIKEPSMFLNGFIQFSFSGGKESKGGAFDAAKDENSIVINKKQLDSFKKAKDLIYDLMSKTESPTKVGSATACINNRDNRKSRLACKGQSGFFVFDGFNRFYPFLDSVHLGSEIASFAKLSL